MRDEAAPTFAELLRSHRMAERLSQEQLAERAGLSASAVSALERGTRRRVYRDTLNRLADALRLSGRVRSDFESVALTDPRGRRTADEPLFRSEHPLSAVYDLLRRYGIMSITIQVQMASDIDECTMARLRRLLLDDAQALRSSRFAEILVAIEGS